MKVSHVYITIIVITILGCTSSKIFNNNKIRSGKIIYTRYEIVTEEAANKINQGFKTGLRELFKDKKDSVQLENFVNSSSHDVMRVKPKNDSITFYLNIFPEYFIQPYYYTDGREHDFVKYRDRDSLYSCEKIKNKLETKCKYPVDIKYFDESNYKITYLPKERKNILGYDCFKIIASHFDNQKHTYEMYVTDKVNLGYNYIINFKSLNSKYLILELKKTTPVVGSYSGYYTNFIELKT